MEEEHITFTDGQPKRKQRKKKHGQGMPKTNMIIVYTVVVCLSCLYLETQHFQYILNDKKAYYMALLTYFDVFMCLWSYAQTIRVGNKVPKLLKIRQHEGQTQKFYDYSYSPTSKLCTICNNYKFPRVHHCSTCGSCQYKMDHHCIWTQTCIGYNNQKSFYLFCIYMALGVFQFWYFTYRVISERTGPFLQIVEPGVMILWTFTALSAFSVGMMIVTLSITHTIMMLTNWRTIDIMKSKTMCPIPFFQKGQNIDRINLFDRGQLQNIKSFFGPIWWLWWVPTSRQPQNDMFPQPMSPHPTPLGLMKSTNLYDLEFKYKQEMRRLPELNFLPFFIGKKMKINDEIFLIGQEEKG